MIITVLDDGKTYSQFEGCTFHDIDCEDFEVKDLDDMVCTGKRTVTVEVYMYEPYEKGNKQ